MELSTTVTKKNQGGGKAVAEEGGKSTRDRWGHGRRIEKMTARGDHREIDGQRVPDQLRGGRGLKLTNRTLRGGKCQQDKQTIGQTT